MALGVCIPDLIAQGKIPEGRAAELRRSYDRLVKQYQGEGMSRPVAEGQATDMALKLLERESLLKKRRALLQMQAQGRWLDTMRLQARRPDGVDGPLDGEAARVWLELLDKKIDALRGRYFATLDKLLVNHRRNLLGEVRNKGDLELSARALFGEKVDDLNAREIADAYGQTREAARQRFNAAGGAIRKLENYGLPMRHDSELVMAAPYEQWRSHPSIENARVFDIETGTYATGMRREAILREARQTIATDGANKAKPGTQFPGSMANRGSESRIIHFASFDDWNAYRKDFGAAGDIYDVMMGSLHALARDTAIIEEMGPNPAATIRFQKEWIEKAVSSDAGPNGKRNREKLTGITARMQATFDELTGANKVPADERIALAFSALRAQQVAAKLGSAMLSAVNDFGTLLWTAGYNDIPINKVMGSYVKLWASGEDRALAVRLGLVTDDWIGMSSSAARYTGEELTGEVSKRLAEIVIRGQGLARHTRNAQWAFGMQFLSHLTHMADRPFTQLDPGVQRVMRNNGLGEAEWDAYRSTPRRQERGADWIMPTDAGKAGDRVLEMVLRETDYAIIMPDIRTRVQMNSFMQPGTLRGEIFRSTVLFKSFPMAMWNLHGRRMLSQPGAWSKARYAIGFGLYMTTLGALAAQLKLVASGKDPQPMNTPQFLGKAIVQSGGLGLFGDLLYNSENSYGGGILATLAGPLLGQTLPGFADATGGNLLRAMDGDDKTESEFVKDTALAIEREIPGRNLWYSRLAWERLVSDNVRELVDPKADEAFARQVKRAEKEGTAYYAPPGEGLDWRMPSLENTLGEE